MKAVILFVALFACLPLSTDAKLRAGRRELKIIPKEKRALQSLNYRGSDPSSRLGQCEGDCDNDGDCEGDLICFQKGSGGSGKVPGCSGRDTSNNDFCIDPDDLSGPAPSPTSSSGPRNFKLKMYWEEGYYWQEERKERKWCMRCPGGSCSSGEKLYIDECGDSDIQRFDFDYVDSDEALIKIHGSNRCLERSGRDIYVRSCDDGNSRQRWWAKRGDFDGSRFEISQKGATDLCVTQRHHPKTGEEVELESCSTARADDTSYWERY